MQWIYWPAILGLGATAQFFIVRHQLLPGLLLYLMGGAWLAFRSFPAPASFPGSGDSPATAMPPRWRTLLEWSLLILALAAAGLAIGWVRSGARPLPPHPEHLAYALYSWLAFLVFSLLWFGLTLWDDLRHETRRSLAPLLILLGISLTLGLFRLTTAPFTVHGDEGMVGLHARLILEGKIDSFFSTSWYSIPQFFFAIPAGGLYLFGDNLFGLRMSTVILGTLSVIPFYLLVRGWWGEKTAVFATLALITNHWFIHLLHCGVNYVQVSFFTITLLTLWAYAHHRRSRTACVGAGIVMGLGLMSYQANHLLPILWTASQIWIALLRRPPLRWTLASTGVPLAIAALVLAPLLVHDYTRAGRTEMFQTRAQGVVAWTPDNLRHLDSVYHAGGDISWIFRRQMERAFLSPILYADTSMQYNGQAPFLNPVLSVLFMLGVTAAAFRFYDIRGSVPVGWIVGILLAGGVLTVDAPFFPRLAGAAPLLFLPMAGVMSRWFGEGPVSLKSIPALFLAAAVFVSAGIDLGHYFGTYARTIDPAGIHYAQTRMAYIIQSRGADQFAYILRGPHFSFGSGTVQFLAKGHRGLDIDRLPDSMLQENAYFIVDESQAALLPALKERFPAYTIHEYTNPPGQRIFISLTPD
ncbi:MAG: ArnT family glycosyltransferase [bacterium]